MTDVDALARRLEIGWRMIDAERDSIRRRQLEDHWLVLLRQYERACDQLESAYVAQPLEVAS